MLAPSSFHSCPCWRWDRTWACCDSVAWNENLIANRWQPEINPGRLALISRLGFGLSFSLWWIKKKVHQWILKMNLKWFPLSKDTAPSRPNSVWKCIDFGWTDRWTRVQEVRHHFSHFCSCGVSMWFAAFIEGKQGRGNEPGGGKGTDLLYWQEDCSSACIECV